MEKKDLKEIVKFFSFDYNAIGTNDILDIHRCLMKKTQYKTMFGIIKKCLLYY